ncbi:MAG: hypothetical protein HAW58_04710 [Candidatus Thioglobus sp.]|nr:hypothetical protein [Candidatus Thioglobus sp.]
MQNIAAVKTQIPSKGPFVAGATVTAYVLTNGIRNTATAATTATTTVTTGNLGAFEFANLDSGITELEITGNYLNENDNSTATVGTLTSIININGDFSNNINIFTDLEARRIKALMAANSMDFVAAKSAATAAVANLFNLSADDVNLSALDLTDGTNEDNLILLRASAAVANTPDILANLQTAAADMQNNNLNENTAGAQALEDLNSEYGTLNFDQIAANITGLGTSTAIAATALAALNQAPTLTITTSTRRIDEDSGLIPIDIEFGNDGNPPSTDENDITLLADSNFSVVSTNPNRHCD